MMLAVTATNSDPPRSAAIRASSRHRDDPELTPTFLNPPVHYALPEFRTT
jgi:hypothetical protein